MGADSSNPTRILALTNVRELGWSPDGTQLVYKTSTCGGQSCAGSLSIVNADGTGAHPLPVGNPMPSNPRWSPEGGRIVYWRDLSELRPEPPDVFTVRPDGTEDFRLTRDGASLEASWAPNAQRILFSNFDGSSPSWLRSMNPDGSGRLTIP